MSDSRFHLKVEFLIYGEKFEWNLSLNWFSQEGEIDQRVTDWFKSCHDKAYHKYQEANWTAERARQEREERERDMAELARLKAKYAKVPTTEAKTR